jgi:hypothetical protein
MIMGFNIIFALVGKNLGSISSQAYKNYTNYYNVAQARFLTESAANIAAGQLSADTNYSPSSATVSLWGGSYKITKSYPNLFWVEYAQFTVDATYPSVGGIQDTTVLLETKARFSEYAMYSVNENGIFWKAGEVCNGPLYTQDQLNIDGNPTFNGPVTAIGGWTGDAAAAPLFNGGYFTGPPVFLPSDLTSLLADANSGGRKFTSDTYIDFNKNGKIYVRTGSYTGSQVSGSPFSSISTLTGNGALVVQGANLHIKGQLDGRITVGSLTNSGSGGTVWIDSSITYKVPPLLADGTSNPDPLNNDLLGIVADNDVAIDDNTSNDANLTINGSILCRTGGLNAENYNTTRRIGTLTLVGGIQQFDRKGVGTFNSTTGAQLHGFQKNYSFDPRLGAQYPPSYPRMQRYRVLSWYDKVRWDANFWD